MRIYVFLLLLPLLMVGTGIASQRSIDPREIFMLAGINPESLKTMSALHALRPELAQATHDAHLKTFAKGEHELDRVKAILAQALRREHALTKNGYTVLYHATSGQVHALQLFYKNLSQKECCEIGL